MKSHRSNSFAQSRARVASSTGSSRSMPSRPVWEFPGGTTQDTDPPSLRSAIEAALTAVSSGQPVPRSSVEALIAEARKALSTGRLGVMRDRIGGATTASPKEKAGDKALESARVEALTAAEAKAAAANADLEEGAPRQKANKPGKLDNRYYQGFAALWDAVCLEASPSERTVLALAMASHDDLWSLSGGVDADDIIHFGMERAPDFAKDVARAAPRLGADALWCAYIHGMQPSHLVSADLFEATPAHIRPELIDRLMRDEPSRKRLASDIDLLEKMIGDISPTDINYLPLAAQVATRDAGKLSAEGRRRWANTTTLQDLQGFSSTAQANLKAVLDPTMMSNAITEWLDGRVKDASLGELVDLFDRRFAIAVGPRNGMTFEEDVLKQLWTELGRLPASDVANNPSVNGLLPEDNQSKYAAGGHSVTTGDIYLSYSPSTAATQTLDDIDNVKVNEKLEGLNALSHALRHEVGHAVDDNKQVMASNRGTTALGGWETYSSDAAVATAMANESPVKVGNAALAEALSSGDADQVRKLGGKELNGVANTLDPDSRTWIGEPTTQVGKHVYRTGADGWVRYDADARDRKVSDYQFKSPGEWFAEAYAAYYALDTPGAGLSMDAKAAEWIGSKVAED